MIRHNARRVSLLAVLIASLVTLPAMAQSQVRAVQPQPSLGQSWPQLANVSAVPGWRVCVFVKDKVKYIQVNDLVGAVHATLATADGDFLVLPLGVDAQRVSTPARPLAAALHSTSPSITVYQDNEVQLTARYQSDGSVLWAATAKKSPKTMTTQSPQSPRTSPAETAMDCPPCAVNSSK